MSVKAEISLVEVMVFDLTFQRTTPSQERAFINRPAHNASHSPY